jgi:prepilin-type processing-associated H-X9-DG protein
MYADDNRGLLPALLGGTSVTNGGGGGIHIKVHTHGKWAVEQDFGPLGNVGVMICPTDQKPVAINTTDLDDNPLTIYTSYAYNYALWITGARIQDVQGSTVMLATDSLSNFDPQQGVWYSGVNNSPGKKGKDVDNFNTSVIARRHNGRFNCLFLDNHVESLRQLPYDSILPGWQ